MGAWAFPAGQSVLPRRHCSTSWVGSREGRQGVLPSALCSLLPLLSQQVLPGGACRAGQAQCLSAAISWLSLIYFLSRREAAALTGLPRPPHLALPSPPGHISRPSPSRGLSASTVRLFCLTTRKRHNTAGRERENTPNTSKRCDSGGGEGLLPQETACHTGEMRS